MEDEEENWEETEEVTAYLLWRRYNWEKQSWCNDSETVNTHQN